MGKKAKKKRERNNVIRLVADPNSLTRRVEAALARREVDAACRLLSQARQLRRAFNGEVCAGDRELRARAFAVQAYRRWDKAAQALDSLDRAIEWMPESADLRRLRGNILRRMGRTKLAVAELAEARRLAPEDNRIGLEFLLAGLAKGAGGEDLIGQVAGLSGPVVDRARALIAAFRGDPSSAEGIVAVSQEPLDRLLHAVLLLAQGQSARALIELEKVVALEKLPDSCKAYAFLYLGIARVQRRDLVLAADALDKASTLGSPEGQVQTYLGWVCQQLAIDAVLGEDLSAAARWFGRLESLGGPDTAAARSNLAQALTLVGQDAAKAGDFQRAAAAWSQALDISPRDAALRQNLAIALERSGREDEAIPHWNELVRQIPREAKRDARQQAAGKAGGDDDEMLRHIQALAHQHLADLYLEQDEVDRAIEQMERALRILPSDVDIRRGLATALIDEGRFGRAAPLLEQVVADAPGSANDHVELGLAHMVLGNEQVGAEHLEKALALEPDHPMARLSLAKALTQRTLKSPKAPNALGDAQRAMELLPAAGAFFGLVACGAAQLARGDRRAADKCFREATKGSPDKPDTLVKIGRVYWDAGETKAAVAAWTRAMKEAKKIPCAYADLAEAWAKAGDGPRCEECLAASLNHNEDEALEAIENISKWPELQPFLRQVLHHVAAFTGDLMERAYLVQGLIYSGDMPGARALLRSVARQAAEEDDDDVLKVAIGLDLKYKYSLLDRSTAKVVHAWIDENPGRLR